MNAPADLKAKGRGRRFLAALDSFELRPDEEEIAVETARLLDLVDELRVAVEEGGLLAEGSAGQPVAHPLLGELRHLRAELRQHFRQLGLPDVETGESDRSRSASAAAEARWGRRASA